MVVSALSGTTDLILELLDRVSRGDQSGRDALLQDFTRNHRRVAMDAGLPVDSGWYTTLDDAADFLLRLADKPGITLTDRDAATALGEKLSAALLVELLQLEGENAVLVAATDLIVTNGPPGDAIPDQAATRRAVQESLAHLLSLGKTPVIPGFIGRGPQGETFTLGRGGTDLTATLLARAIDAERVVLWKDVPGFLTADPRIVPDARRLDAVHRLEAADLAWYGAKVLHPRALAPLVGTRIPIQIRPFAEPEDQGTTITAQRDLDAVPLRAIAMVRDQTLLTVTGGGVVGVPAIAARLFSALREADIPVAMVAQASAESAIDCTVANRHAGQAVDVLRRLLRDEIQQGHIDGVERRDGIAILAVVGLAMVRHTGVAARIFDALADAGINIVAIVQSAGERNISVMIEEDDAPEAMRRIHAAFQLNKLGGGRPARRHGRDIVLLGAGTIGRIVLSLLAQHPERFESLRVIGVLDRSGAALAPDGFTPSELAELAAWKGSGKPLRSLPDGVAGDSESILAELTERALVRPVLVDLTASDTAALLQRAAEAGWDLVLANKQPLAGPATAVALLRQTLARHHAKLRHEATVGAGLPILESLQQLIATGDRIRSLEGCLSGTLGAVLSAVEQGTPFSQAVRAARDQGLTEPDPRDDLGGLDVARKALILARAIGVQRELAEIALDSLVLDGAELSVEQWLERLPAGDRIWEERIAGARGKGAVLRYVASVTPDGVRVGLRELPLNHPLAQLQGTANQLVYTSDRYSESPLVITGPGAGPEVTATGVLADLLALSS